MSNGSGAPPCGGNSGTVGLSITWWQIVLLVLGILLGLAEVFENFVITFFAILFKLVVSGLGAASGGTISILGIPIFVPSGVSPVTYLAATAAVAIAAAIASTAITYWLWSNWWNLSSNSVPFGIQACIAGVVDQLQGPNTDPFSLAHGSVQVVVKQSYWSVVAMGNPVPFVWCEDCQNCPESAWPPGTTQSNANTTACSPMLPCVYYSQTIVNMALGEAIGGTVGALAGAVVGTIVGDTTLAALAGCAATGPLYFICLVAVVLLAAIIAVAIVAAAAAVGGGIGYGIGDAASSGNGEPSGSQGGSTVTIAVGSYVTITGNLVTTQNFNGSNTIYFAGWIPNLTTKTVVNDSQSNGNGTTVFGMSTGTSPFCHTDPDQNIPDTADASCLASNPSS
jgi:hypothetical protein